MSQSQQGGEAIIINIVIAICIIVIGFTFWIVKTITNDKEIERNTCVPSIIKVDAIETFTCKAKGKVSQQTIDDVKYNVCTCKE